MNYELCKKLKDVGFSQNIYNNFYPIDCGVVYSNNGYSGIPLEHRITIPTLSELIRACEISFSELTKMTHNVNPERWVATSLPCDECGIEKMCDGFGLTPEEAVANLWLKLNEKHLKKTRKVIS